MKKLPLIIILICSSIFFASAKSSTVNLKLDLSGQWQFALDTASVGESDQWHLKNLSDNVTLPGTTDLNKKSHIASYQCNCLVNAMKKPAHKHCSPYTDTTSYHYTREYPFTGKAWYRKLVIVPESFKNKHIQLQLERTKVSKVWIDDKYVGGSSLLSAMQVFDVSNFLTAGKHTITIMVDNDPKLVKTGFSHIYSYDTQTNWNGILGEMSLNAYPVCHVTRTDVFPDVANKAVVVKFKVVNPSKKKCKLNFNLSAKSWNATDTQLIKPMKYSALISTADSTFTISYPMSNNPLLWSEFSPAMYKLDVSVKANRFENQQYSLTFGMRDFKTQKSQFSINGNKIFLRGKHDGCVFPLTGHAPTDTATWMRYLKITKDYGMNHVRFHSWCPPKAAFEAADMLGMYLQVELPYWGGYSEKDTALIKFMTNEGINMLNQFGNHPSFCMMSLGNELSGNQKVMDNMTKNFKNYDSRHLYTYGTNSNFSNPAPGANDDFWPTGWTGKEKHNDQAYHVRSAFATNEDATGGLINAVEPSTTRNYAEAIKEYHIPVIGHEIGQFQVYPNFDEIKKYTGVLKPYNYEVFKRRLAKAGMAHQADAFFRSTGQSCILQYREEFEAALRTPGFGGFQVLDLQDYPGQVTAIIGILDPFMDSKGIITPKKFREFCSEVVPLVIMPKHCYSNSEVFSADVKVANYSFVDLSGKNIDWKLLKGDSTEFIKGNITTTNVKNGELSNIGSIQFSLNNIKKAEKFTLVVVINGTTYRNEYPIWVYPTETAEVKSINNVRIIQKIDTTLISEFKNGGVFLLFPDHKSIENKSVGPQFINEFWSWYMFKGICESNNRPVSAGTLGLLVDPKHPAFKNFPTEIHSNWQWWNVMKSARPFIMDTLPSDIEPIVQVIDNIDRNHKLGILFEFKCGNAKILVCTADLNSKMEKPEVKSLYSGILQYVSSDMFNPQTKLSEEMVIKHFVQK